MDRCEELTGYLAAYADGELAGELCERVERHLEECERCRGECADLKKVVALYRASTPPEVGAEDWAKVSAAVEECMAERATGIERIGESARRGPAVRWWLFPAASLAAAMLLVAFLVRSTTPPPTVQLDDVQTGANYEFIVRAPMNDDLLIIDVLNVE